MEIRELLDQTSNLPNVPDVVKELIQHLNNPDSDYDAIAKKVTQDQTLSLKVLRLVNSAHFGLSKKVSSIEEAVVMLGFSRLKTMVIASGLVGSVKEVEGLDLRQFWNEAFTVASVAEFFAKRTEKVEPDMAFTAGLIHNIGRLLLHLSKPKLAQAIQTRIEESGCSRSDAEMERLNFTSPEAGQALLDMWSFPEELGVAVRQHKKPLEFEEPSPLAAVINMACVINAAKRNETELAELRDFFPMDVAALAGRGSGILAELGEAMELESALEGMS